MPRRDAAVAGTELRSNADRAIRSRRMLITPAILRHVAHTIARGGATPDHGAVLEAAADRMESDAARIHALTESATPAPAAEPTQLDEARDLLRAWYHSGCPHCSGDCGGANPPI